MKKEKLQQLGHLAAGLITIVHGFDTLEKGDLFPAVSYVGLALLFMIFAGAHKWMKRHFMQGDVALFLLEALTIFYSGWHYKRTGDTALYYSMVTASVFFLAFACISVQWDDKPRRHSRHRKKRRSSSSSLGSNRNVTE